MPVRAENRGRYPDNWPEIRERLLARAGDACEWCGAQNHEPHPRTGSHVVLTVAHVYDKRPEAVDDGNLALLCQKCHNRHDSAGRSRRLPTPPPGPGPIQVPLTEVPGGPP